MNDISLRRDQDEASQNRRRGITHGFMTSLKKTMARLRGQASKDDELREAIEDLIEDKDTNGNTLVAGHERALITNILELRDLPVVDAMVPRADIVAIDINISKDDLYTLMSERPHSRLPVYEDDLDKILGVLHMKDVVAKVTSNNHFEIRDLMRDSLVVSPAMRVLDLLLQMRQSRVHIAFVVDEFGGIDGLITINDLIEAIVGEIGDEYDFEVTPQLLERPDGSAIADARYSLEEFEERFEYVFSDEDEDDIDTLGGLVNAIAGHVPVRGEVIIHDSSGMEFEIIDADPRRVMRLRLRNLPPRKTVQ